MTLLVQGEETGYSYVTIKHSDYSVLFISSYSYEWQPTAKQIEGIQNTLHKKAEINYMFMDTKNVDEALAFNNLHVKLKAYYEGGKSYDAVIVGDDAALEAVLACREEFFADIPVIFEGVNSGELAAQAQEKGNITGLIENISYYDSIQFARTLYPRASNFVCILDNTITGIEIKKQYEQSALHFPDMHFEDLNTSELSPQEIVDKLAALDSDTILLYGIFSEDGYGNLYSLYDAVRLVVENVKIPVFSTEALTAGYGTLGGVCVPPDKMGEEAAKMLLTILEEGDMVNTPIAEAERISIIDYKVMKQFDIPEGAIPDSTVFINRESKVSFSDYLRDNVVEVFCVITGFIITMLIAFLLIKNKDNKQKKKLENAVRMQQETNKELEKANEQLKVVLEQSHTVTWKYDILRNIAYDFQGESIAQENLSDRLSFSHPLEDMVEAMISRNIVHSDSADDFRRLHEEVKAGKNIASGIFLMNRFNKHKWSWEKVTYINTYDEKGNPLEAIGFSTDVTSEIEKEEQYRALAIRHEAFTQDMYTIASIDLTTMKLLELKTSDEVMLAKGNGGSVQAMITYYLSKIPEDRQKQDIRKLLNRDELRRKWDAGKRNFLFEYQISDEEGSEEWEELSLQMAMDKGHLLVYAYIKDITEKKERENELAKKAERDSLTGVYNRETFKLLVDGYFISRTREDVHIVLGILDLDDFKYVNDTYGHQMGDFVLQQFAFLLKSSLRKTDAVGRLGGDEFLILLNGVTDIDFLKGKIQRLIDNINGISLPKGESVKVSVGLAIDTADMCSFSELYSLADQALYQAKKNGKNQYAISKDSNF